MFYRLSKLAGRYNRDLTPDEKQKSKKDTIAFDGKICAEKALDFCSKIKEEEEKDKKGKVFEKKLQLHAHNVSSFDTWIVLNKLPCDKRIVNNVKNGRVIIAMKIFNGYIEKYEKQIPHYLHFRRGMTHLNYPLRKIGKTFKLQKELLKTEMNHDEVDGIIYKDKLNKRLSYVKNDIFCAAFSYARYFKAMEEVTGFSIKDCLSAPGLG